METSASDVETLQSEQGNVKEWGKDMKRLRRKEGEDGEMVKFYRVAERAGEGRDEVWRDGPGRRQQRECVLGALFF